MNAFRIFGAWLLRNVLPIFAFLSLTGMGLLAFNQLANRSLLRGVRELVQEVRDIAIGQLEFDICKEQIPEGPHGVRPAKALRDCARGITPVIRHDKEPKGSAAPTPIATVLGHTPPLTSVAAPTPRAQASGTKPHRPRPRPKRNTHPAPPKPTPLCVVLEVCVPPPSVPTLPKPF